MIKNYVLGDIHWCIKTLESLYKKIKIQKVF